MTQLHAQPYDLSATGFYFESVEEFGAKASASRNDYGEAVEEYEIQFIDGEDIDCALAEAIGINQANYPQFFECVESWEDHQKIHAIIAIGECGYGFDAEADPDDFDLDVYYVSTLRELAEQFVDEGLFGEIPERIQHYLDYDAIARDLGMDYSEVTIAGERLVYRCA